MVSRSLFQPPSNKCISPIFLIHSGVGMMRRVRTAGRVIEKERLGPRYLLKLLHVLDGIVGHRRGQIPVRLALVGGSPAGSYTDSAGPGRNEGDAAFLSRESAPTAAPLELFGSSALGRICIRPRGG